MHSNPNIKPPLPVQIGPYTATLRIHRDERGVAWVDESNVKVIEVVLDHVQGWSPDKIHEEHSHLSLAQINSAIAYYYDHTQEIDDLMRQWDEEYQQGRAQTFDGPTRAELTARLQKRRELQAVP